MQPKERLQKDELFILIGKKKITGHPLLSLLRFFNTLNGRAALLSLLMKVSSTERKM
jgi:hypothetical protein